MPPGGSISYWPREQIQILVTYPCYIPRETEDRLHEAPLWNDTP